MRTFRPAFAILPWFLVACTYPMVDSYKPADDSQGDNQKFAATTRPTAGATGVDAGVALPPARVSAPIPSTTTAPSASTPPPGSAGMVTVIANVSGSGRVDSNPVGMTCAGQTCSGNFPRGVTVTLTATPGPGAAQGTWSGACGGSGPCTLTLAGDVTVAADMQPITGTFTGTYAHSVQASGCTFNNRGNLTVTFTNNNGVLAGNANITGLEIRNPSRGCSLQTSNATGNAPATAIQGNGAQLTGGWTFNVSNNAGQISLPFVAAVSGNAMVGTWNCPGCTGAFTLTKQ
jgi:hypothetical protein